MILLTSNKNNNESTTLFIYSPLATFRRKIDVFANGDTDRYSDSVAQKKRPRQARLAGR